MLVCNQQHKYLPGMFLRFASCLHQSWFRTLDAPGMLRESARSQARTCYLLSVAATWTKRPHCLMKVVLEEQLDERALVVSLP